MKTEEIIKQTIAACPWISRDQILSRLEKEKQKTGGLISDDALLKMIAAEFGCETLKSEPPMPSLLLGDLVPGLNDATVTGRVLATFPPKAFKGTKKGKLASLLIADKSGILRVVLWNDKTSLLESRGLNVGHMTRFFHGYTRADLSGKVELHVGEKGEVEINPADVKRGDYPDIGKFSTKIGGITASHRNKRANIIGMVKEIFPASTFERADSSQGKVMRFVLTDPTGEIPVVVWNEKADELEKTMRAGDKLQIVNAKVKKALGEGLEAHVDTATYIGTLAQIEEFLNIVDLKEGMNQINVEGEVATKPTVRDVKTTRGELLKLATFELKDETGKIWVSAWRKHVEIACSLRVGDEISIRNVYVKKGFGDQLEISTRDTTSITIGK